MNNIRHIISREMPKWKCPHCKKVLDCATAAVENPEQSIPTQQDFTVCAYCQTFLRFSDTGYQFASAADLALADPESRMIAEGAFGPIQVRA